jgi:hypothetical protein
MTTVYNRKTSASLSVLVDFPGLLYKVLEGLAFDQGIITISAGPGLDVEPAIDLF